MVLVDAKASELVAETVAQGETHGVIEDLRDGDSESSPSQSSEE